MVTWRDIVKINGNIFGFEAEIDPTPDKNGLYDCDKFFEKLAETHDVSVDDIETLLFDDIDISKEDIERIKYGIEDCGVVIDNVVQ